MGTQWRGRARRHVLYTRRARLLATGRPERERAEEASLLPVEYQHGTTIPYRGLHFPQAPFEQARVVILPLPFDRSSGAATGTRLGPRAILEASAHLSLWDEEMECEAARIGVCTLPEMRTPPASLDDVVAGIRRVIFESHCCGA